MAKIIPSLFQLIGQGFENDAYASDGNHLRWQFDPRLGFPRFPFCVQRRPALGTKPGYANNLPRHFEAFASAEEARENRLVRSGFSVARTDGSAFARNATGLVLPGTPLVIDFHQGNGGVADPYACYVRLVFRLQAPGGRVDVEGQYLEQGEPVAVARAEAAERVRPFRPPVFERIRPRSDLDLERLELSPDLERLIRTTEAGRRPGAAPESEGIEAARHHLAEPALVRSAPVLRSAAHKRLHRELVRHDPKYSRVSAAWIAELGSLLQRHRIDLGTILRPETRWTTHVLELRASRIDRVVISGSRAILAGMEWVRTEALMAQRDWTWVECLSIATGEEEYARTNQSLLRAESWRDEVDRRVMEPMPKGAEPLDDRQVPPSRAPTEDERRCRYIEPWIRQQEPWLREVLSRSHGGGLHMSEVTLEGDLDEAGQAPGEGVPRDDWEDTKIEFQPYGMLLASAQAFPTARLLGLATIDTPEPHHGLWDYRVVGFWDARDIFAWAGSLMRKAQRLSDRLAADGSGDEEPLTPSERAEVETERMATASELWSTILFLVPLVSGSSNGVVDLWALKLGVGREEHGLFEAPDTLEVAFHEFGRTSTPDAPSAVSLLSWTLRDRARFLDQEATPMLAALARSVGPGTSPFDMVLNPVHPAAENIEGCHAPQGVIPHDPADEAGAPAVATFLDRRVADGEAYVYGVSEADPFGRWSPFTPGPFTWSYDVPPRPPSGVEGEMEEADTGLALSVKFRWNHREGAPAGMAFGLALARTLPPGFPDDPETGRDPAQWNRLGRTSSSAAGVYWFAGDASVADDPHDGMEVDVTFADEVDGGDTIREYRVTVRGLEISRDALERARAYVGVRTRDARSREASEVAGPAPVEHVRVAPPPPVEVPPDPETATFADAQGLSSYTLSWDGAAQTRYVVLKAGERDLVRPPNENDAAWAADLSAAGYDPSGPDNERAAALKSLAATARQAFQPLSDPLPVAEADPNHPYGVVPQPPPVPAGERAYTDTLPGSLRTLTLYTVLGVSPAGVQGAWPGADGFVAVKVPRAPEPSRPVVLRGVWREGLSDPEIPPALAGHGVELHVARPPLQDETDPSEVAPVAAYEVYRTRAPEKARDVRHMRLLHRLDDPDWAPIAGGGDEVPIAVYTDPTADAWSRYYYRVVARYRGNGRPGMRSEASAPLVVDTRSSDPPEPASDLAAVRVGDEVHVEFRAPVPVPPSGRFRFEIRNMIAGRAPVVGRMEAEAARMSGDLFEVPVDGDALPTGDRFVVRVVDPAGRWSESPEVPVP